MNRAYDTLCKYIQKEFPRKPKAYGVQQVEPGEEAEVDFGYVGMQPDYPDRLVKTWVLIVKLSWSRQNYYQFCRNQQLTTLMKELDRAFVFFGGVPKRVKVDNMRTAILVNQHYDLQFNQDFLEFASHYGFVITACTPYHPEQKGKVEREVQYFKSNFMAGREVKDAADMDQQLAGWTRNYANQRIHNTTKKVPGQQWQTIEKLCLQPLPENEFAFFERVERTVKPNCHISFNNNYYSAPSLLAGKKVIVRFNENVIRIIHNGEQAALHHIAKNKQGEYITVRSHLPDYKCFSQAEYQSRCEEKMRQIGSHAHSYFKTILLKQEKHWPRTIRCLLGLAKTYGNQTLNLSLERALHYGVIDIPTIRNICEKKLYRLDKEWPLDKNNQAGIDDGADNSSTGVRSLNYYQAALMEDLAYGFDKLTTNGQTPAK